MQECFQLLGRFDREGRSESMRTRRPLVEHGESGCIEAFDRIANGLVVAAQIFGDSGGALPTGRGEQHLAASQHEGIGRTQPRLDLALFVWGQWSNKNGGFHALYSITFPMTFRQNALASAFASGGTGEVSTSCKPTFQPT